MKTWVDTAGMQPQATRDIEDGRQHKKKLEEKNGGVFCLRVFRRSQPCQHLDLWLQDSKTDERIYVLVRSFFPFFLFCCAGSFLLLTSFL